jgi:hypothetical protein
MEIEVKFSLNHKNSKAKLNLRAHNIPGWSKDKVLLNAESREAFREAHPRPRFENRQIPHDLFTKNFAIVTQTLSEQFGTDAGAFVVVAKTHQPLGMEPLKASVELHKPRFADFGGLVGSSRSCRLSKGHFLAVGGLHCCLLICQALL